jgi:hypothetical protein
MFFHENIIFVSKNLINILSNIRLDGGIAFLQMLVISHEYKKVEKP